MQRTKADEIWRINVGKRVTSTIDGTRSSPITTVEQKDRHLLLQGIQNGWAWRLALYAETGRMSGDIADADGVITLSSGCTAP
jgi:hypothetical protein